MNSICHKIVVECEPQQMFDAINTVEGLTKWWTAAEFLDSKKDLIVFSFGPDGEHKAEMRIENQDPHSSIVWSCVSGPWIHTDKFIFEIEPHERGCTLDFSNTGWDSVDDFFKHCNTKWGFFLAVSLKDYMETGVGKPHPNEPSI